jgi:hypothetical protein
MRRGVCGRGHWFPSRRCSGSSSSSLLGEGDDDFFTVVLHSSSSSSCGYAETEIGDFPSASMLPDESRFSQAPGGSGGGRAAVRLRSTSTVTEEWFRVWFVISVFFEILCTAVIG